MDDLLDDDKDLFGDVKSEKDSMSSTLPSSKEPKANSAGGGLFDDFLLDEPEKEHATANGHNGMFTQLLPSVPLLIRV